MTASASQRKRNFQQNLMKNHYKKIIEFDEKSLKIICLPNPSIESMLFQSNVVTFLQVPAVEA
jgi:hypothetical protein